MRVVKSDVNSHGVSWPLLQASISFNIPPLFEYVPVEHGRHADAPVILTSPTINANYSISEEFLGVKLQVLADGKVGGRGGAPSEEKVGAANTEGATEIGRDAQTPRSRF